MKEKRTDSIMVRVSEDEKEYIATKARKLGLLPSTYLRMLGIKGKSDEDKK